MKKRKSSKIEKMIKISWIVWLICVVGFIIFAATSSRYSSSYAFPWPGMLPDNKLYKLKVARNKVIEKLIIHPVKKVEFDLLMADKLIYSSTLLMAKGEVELAKETALKGENYYSILVQDYNRALLENKKIPPVLDKKITKAAAAHQQVFKTLENAARGDDKKAFQAAHNFSKINYEFIKGLRKPKRS